MTAHYIYGWVINIYKFWFLEFLKTLEDNICEYLKFLVTLKDDPVTIQISVYQTETPLFHF